MEKAGLVPVVLGVVEEELRRVPAKGWAAMIRMVCEVDPLLCPRCGGAMRVVAFLTEHAVVDLRCGEAPAAASRLSGISYGRRSAG